MGPIWDNNDANMKAAGWVAQNPGWRYTGEWRTTIPNVMSTITVEQLPQAAPQVVVMQQPMFVPQPVIVPQPVMMAPPMMMAPQPMGMVAPMPG